MSSAVVVGGGVTGLVAARTLALRGLDVTVMEASGRWGGKLGRSELDGVALDTGAESVLARRPEAVGLIAELGLGGSLVHPTPAQPQALVGGQVRALPPSVLGVPADLDALTGYLSVDGLARARREPGLPAPALVADVSVGRYVDDRFGSEVTDRLLEPLLGGVYAGQARQLSFAAVSPALFERARHGGSLLAHAAELAASAPSGAVFAGLVGGISTLVTALVTDLRRRGVHLRANVPVRELHQGPGGGHRLVCGPASAPEVITADVVVLAVPAGPTGRLLSGLTPVAEEWAAIPYASTVVVSLAVRHLELTGSGLLVPPGELPTIKALTHSSRKWAWVAEEVDRRWGPVADLVRVSVGRLGEEHLLQVDDDTLLARTFAEAATLPGWAGAQLVAGQVHRWGGALPQYRVGHRELVARLRRSLAQAGGLAVCGAALDGVGVAACLASANAAVDRVTAALSATTA
ncbi:MAG TPA: protoporphyrinogen oxidase [Propionibacteriaceae bacterium]|nr:protoporphyrinogen oxidase [Propionibacteriaceae bacterium]